MTDDKEILERMDQTFDEVRNIHEELKKRLHEDRERFQKGKAAEIELLTQYVEVFDKRSDMSQLVSSINSFNERLKAVNKDAHLLKKIANLRQVRHVMFYDKEIDYLKRMGVDLHNFVVSKEYTIERWNARLKQYDAAKEGRIERFKAYGDKETGEDLQKVFDEAEKTDWHCLLDQDVKKKRGIPTMIRRLEHGRPNATQAAQEHLVKHIEEALKEMQKEFETIDEVKSTQDLLKEVEEIKKVQDETARDLSAFDATLKDLQNQVIGLLQKIDSIDVESEKITTAMPHVFEQFNSGALSLEQLQQYGPYLKKLQSNIEEGIKAMEEVNALTEKGAEVEKSRQHVIEYLPKLMDRSAPIRAHFRALTKKAA